ncbi:MAG TPA: nuclear transport factor 2 family protein [Thermoanaerobaculia bacterium]|nr:nuclear transport factor 2 family protein [Thermoanaerobaculia bacterium]
MRDEVEALTERERIVDTIHALFSATDARDWDGVEECFAERVRFDTTSLVGGEPVELAPSEITEAWDRELAPILHVHHQVGNLRVRLGGDRAIAHCHGTAHHFRPVASGSDVRTFVGTYEFRLRLEDGEWRIDDFRYHHKFLTGNADLDREAPARA